MIHKVYEPWIRALLGTAAQSCKAVILKLVRSALPYLASQSFETTITMIAIANNLWLYNLPLSEHTWGCHEITVPHGGTRTFHRKSTYLYAIELRVLCGANWSRYPQHLGVPKPS